MSARNRNESACLIDHVVGPAVLGPPRALLATTFELNADFVEHDFLPSLLSLTNKDDRSTRARLQLEEQLAKMDVAALLMDAECYRARPCSLRVHVTARRAAHAGRLHPKVTVIVHEEAVRLIVGSANLTEPGYRGNREVALSVYATAKKPETAAFIAKALEAMPDVLATWWNPEAEKVRTLALELATKWRRPEDDDGDRFVWSGPGRPLWRQFAEQWPRNEPLKRLIVVSPFWSREHEQGQVEGLLRALRERGSSTDGAQVELLTNAVPEKEGTFLPQAHPSFATYNFCALGIEATLQAVDPQVNEEGFEKDGRLRNLHAKVVLAKGTTTSLAYAGSANFTTRGWGFGNHGKLNIEAGVLLRREGKGARALLSLIPATTGKAQRLDGSRTLQYRPLADSTDQPTWPTFVELAELVPHKENDERLLLRILLFDQDLPERVSIRVGGVTGATLLWEGSPPPLRVIQVQLSAEVLRALLMQKEVLVEWTGMQSPGPVAFPLNIAALAREQLPFSTAAQLIGESELVAFYQGRLSFEDLFPGELGQADPDGDAVDADPNVSAVDTTQILSYQIREFVEALPGIRQELERAGGTVSSIRLALLGPVSPVALARTVEEAVGKGRSAVAGAFQLLELVLCLRRVKRPQLDESRSEAWTAAHREAERKVLAAYERVLQAAPRVRENPQFRRYETLLESIGGAS